MSKRPATTGKNTPLRVSIKRNVLTIEIGVSTLAMSALHSPHAFDLMGPAQKDPRSKYVITNEDAFAYDVKAALTDERGEDGSSYLTTAFDAAFERAIDDGSEWFVERLDVKP